MKKLRLFRYAMASAAIAVFGLMPIQQPQPVFAPPQIGAPARIIHANTSIPGVLSASDIERYIAAQKFTRAGNWRETDAALAQVENPVLTGAMLAMRYTDKRYTPTQAELDAWFAEYKDSAAAENVAASARKRGLRAPAIPYRMALKDYADTSKILTRTYRPSLVNDTAWGERPEAFAQWEKAERLVASHRTEEAKALLESEESAKLNPLEADALRWELAEQYFHNDDAKTAYSLITSAMRSAETLPAIRWTAGIAAWRLGDKHAAVSHFAALAAREEIPPSERSAAAYWAYRGHAALENAQKAARYLKIAAAEPRTFYGALARAKQGRQIFEGAKTLDVSEAQLAELYRIPAVARAVALAQLANDELAEKELRRVFFTLKKPMRVQLLALVEKLHLPVLQMAMAGQMLQQGGRVEHALYPVPEWQPHSGFALDPSLVFALARQESGFRAGALGAGGALGLMQLMPNTARLMRLSLKNTAAISPLGMMEPEANITLGQHYVRRLMREPGIGDSMFDVIAAYNAGPGRLSGWRAQGIVETSDPLLFLETIPYAITRAYVKQVMTNYWIYQELQGATPQSALALAEGKWPRYRHAQPAFAER